MRPRSWIRWSVWSGVVGLVLTATVVWFVSSELSLRWAVERTIDAFGGRLVIEQPERIGLGEMRFRRVAYTDEKVSVQATDVVLKFSASSLLRGSPVVHKLMIDELRIRRMGQAAQPPRLPDSLALPFEARVESVEIARVIVEDDQGASELGSLAFALAHEARRYHLTRARAGTPWAGITGELTLDNTPPFALSGAFSVSPQPHGIEPFALALAGRLDAIGVGAYGAVYGGEALAQAFVAPFADQTLVMRARLEALDLRKIYPRAPNARLRIESTAMLDAGGTVSGRLRLDNAEPGSPAQSRLPIVQASGAFRGSAARWTFDEIAVNAGRAGRLGGKGSLEGQQLELELLAHGLDLKALYPEMHRTALSGPLRLESDGTRLIFRAVLSQVGLRATLDGELAQDRLTLRDARFSGNAGELVLKGAVTPRAPYRFSAVGNVHALDPSRLGAFPSARINATFSGDGELAPLSAALAWNIVDSRYRGQAFAGRGHLRMVPQRVSDVDLVLTLGNARMQALGDFGALSDRLTWSIEAPDLRVFQEGAAGQLRAHGVARGRWQEPSLTFQAEGKSLRWGERIRVGQLDARGTLADGMAGRFEAQATLDRLTLGDVAFDRSRIELAGTRASHEARVDASGGKHRFEGRVAGSLNAGPAWSGVLSALRLQGPIAARIDQAVPIAVSATSGSVGPAVLHLGNGRIELSSLRWQSDRSLSSRGSLKGISLGALGAVIAVPDALEGLVIAGEWSVDAGTSLVGTASLWREAGDVVMRAPSAVAAGLQSMRIDVHMRDAAIALEARADSTGFGSAHVSGTTRAERRGVTWGIAGDAPIDWRATAHMPSLAWARPLLGDAVRIDAEADLDLKGTGTWARPELAGDLNAIRVRIDVPEPGLALRDGNLQARFDKQRMDIVGARFVSGDGVLEGRGHADLTPGNITARIDLTAQKLTVVSRPDRLIVLSGKAGLDWGKNVLRAKGEFIADRGLIELPREDTPRPSSDVVVLKRQVTAETVVGVHADVRLDLGRNFTVRGRGLDTRLNGTVRAELAPKMRPTVTGTVRASGGTYIAFGQALSIDRGTLTFVGPADNPALDILAMRKNLSVDVGVAVGGTALLPQVRLVSTPSMSDADKLAWLTLGHGLNQAGGNEAAVLQAAALALISRGGGASGFTGTLASRFGLDDLSLGTQSATGERVVMLGKRLATDVYVGFERGVTGAMTIVKITYDLSRRWSVQARAGTENAVDLFYTLGFR